MKPRTKKSETLQVRLPHGMKRDFMQRCEVEGRAASDLIRDFIESYLARPVEILTSERATMIRRRYIYPTVATTAAIAAVVAAVGSLIPSTSHASSLRAEFDAMDANKDGFVVATEFKSPEDGVTYSMSRSATISAPEGLSQLPRSKTTITTMSGAQGLANMFARLDTDGDQRLSFGEYRVMRIGAAQATFNRGDANGDGALSQAEYVAGVSVPAGVLARMRSNGPNPKLDAAVEQSRIKANARFKLLDVDKDGALTLDELTPS